MKKAESMAKLKSGIGLMALAATFMFSSCASSKIYPIPDDKRRTYDETVQVPDVSAEDLFKKVKLHIVNQIDQMYFSYKESEMLNIYRGMTKVRAYERGMKEIYDEGDNRIAFKPFDEAANAVSAFLRIGKKKVKKIEVFVSAGQYRIVGAAIDSVKAKDGELDKELKNLFSEMDGTWKAFAYGMKLAITKQVTDEEFETLMNQGSVKFDAAGKIGEIIMNRGSMHFESTKENSRLLMTRKNAYLQAADIFRTAAIARPNDAKAVFNFGKSLQNAGAAGVALQDMYTQRKMGESSYRTEVSILNQALYVYKLLPQGSPEVSQAISEIDEFNSEFDKLKRRSVGR